jgi:hypothetical protein
LDERRQEWDAARTAANEALTNVAPHNISQVLFHSRRRVDAAYTKLQNGGAYVFTLEAQLGIEERWSVASPEYVRYQGEAVLQEYRKALDDLERLVVMRLFELSKLGMSGTGMLFCYRYSFTNLTNRIQAPSPLWESPAASVRSHSKCYNSIQHPGSKAQPSSPSTFLEGNCRI